MGICAQISIPLVFTTVPITGQTFGVLLLGFLLGPGYGTAAVGAYLVEGALGLPLFAEGSGGIGHLLGPTGGYVLGFLPATWITGTLAQWGWDRHLLGSLAAAAGGLAVIFACGLLVLSAFVGWEKAPALGLFPFLPGALIKVALLMVILPLSWRAVKKFK